MEHSQLFPNSWESLSKVIRSLGTHTSFSILDDDRLFLHAMGIVTKEITPLELTSTGKQLFELKYILEEEKKVKELLLDLWLKNEAMIALQQYFYGVVNVSLEQVCTVLMAVKVWHGDSKELVRFLDFSNYVGIIKYDRKNKRVKILIPPNTESPPSSVYIEPLKQYSNIYWIKKILSSCHGSVMWIDKHFQKAALDWIWSTADANNITDIRIISLNLGDKNTIKNNKEAYLRLKSELVNKGIGISWKTIDSKDIRDSHDRWLLDDKGYIVNLPDVNTINSGSRSEIHQSKNYAEIKESFERYWRVSIDV